MAQKGSPCCKGSCHFVKMTEGINPRPPQKAFSYEEKGDRLRWMRWKLSFNIPPNLRHIVGGGVRAAPQKAFPYAGEGGPLAVDEVETKTSPHQSRYARQLPLKGKPFVGRGSEAASFATGILSFSSCFTNGFWCAILDLIQYKNGGIDPCRNFSII